MPRRLLGINLALGLLCLAFAVGIVRSTLVWRPLPIAPAPRTAAAAAPAVPPAPSVPGLEAYAAIAAQNLFNPARSETVAAAVAVAVVRPILHGVVIEGPKSRAFLEDPSVKRVGGYSVGDLVAGGTLQRIADDRVVIVRPDGPVEVLLQDPAKALPPPAPVVVGAPGRPSSAQIVSVQAPPAQSAVPPAGAAPSQAPTTAQADVLGQVLPSDAPDAAQPATAPQSLRRATAPMPARR